MWISGIYHVAPSGSLLIEVKLLRHVLMSLRASYPEEPLQQTGWNTTGFQSNMVCCDAGLPTNSALLYSGLFMGRRTTVRMLLSFSAVGVIVTRTPPNLECPMTPLLIRDFQNPFAKSFLKLSLISLIKARTRRWNGYVLLSLISSRAILVFLAGGNLDGYHGLHRHRGSHRSLSRFLLACPCR